MQGWDIKNKLQEITVDDDWTCPVCYENLKSNNYAVQFECSDKHIFCKRCLTTMINSTSTLNKDKCPLCRKIIKINFNIKLNNEYDNLESIFNKDLIIKISSTIEIT